MGLPPRETETMMNTFDFWVIDAICERKTPLKKAGVPLHRIEKKVVGYKAYGRQRYPRYRYQAAVEYVDAPEGRDALNAAEAKLRERFAGTGVQLHVRYVCRD
jgi:hypothetical protein